MSAGIDLQVEIIDGINFMITPSSLRPSFTPLRVSYLKSSIAIAKSF